MLNGKSAASWERQGLKSQSGSRPPRFQFRGLLVPIGASFGSEHKRFKLETDSREYLLAMKPALCELAKKIEWEEVTVKGRLTTDGNIIEVEQMTLLANNLSTVDEFEDLTKDLYVDFEISRKHLAS